MKSSFLFSLCAGLVMALAVKSPARADVRVGDTFPTLAEAGLSGAALPDTSGKVVLVDFCASWCAPCKASFPVYSKLQAEYGPKGLVIIGVSVDNQPSAYESLVKKLHPGFVVVNDGANKLVAKVNVPAMPTSFLLDRNGKVLAMHREFHSGSTEAELRKDIEQALAAQPAS